MDAVAEAAGRMTQASVRGATGANKPTAVRAAGAAAGAAGGGRGSTVVNVTVQYSGSYTRSDARRLGNALANEGKGALAGVGSV